MARESTPPEQLQKVSDSFGEMSRDIAKCVEDMKVAKIPYVLIHSKTIRSKHLPELWDWVATVEKDVKSQIRAYLEGVASQAQIEVQKAAKDPRKQRKKGK